TLRSVWIATLIYLTWLVLRNGIDPSRCFCFDFNELRLQLLGSFRWFGTIFAGAYAALYARFASQWSYLASVYNQIKATECKGVDGDHAMALAEWKAGFIEDAFALHLARKPSFRAVILAWSTRKDVEDELDTHIRACIKRLAATAPRLRI